MVEILGTKKRAMIWEEIFDVLLSQSKKKMGEIMNYEKSNNNAINNSKFI